MLAEFMRTKKVMVGAPMNKISSIKIAMRLKNNFILSLVLNIREVFFSRFIE